MPASERSGRARRSQFVPGCATLRVLACWLLALAACLNPVPDTDPSLTVNETPTTGGSPDQPGGSQSGGSDGAGFIDEGEDPSESTPPAVTDPAAPADVSPDAGAPPADAGADAASGGPQ